MKVYSAGRTTRRVVTGASVAALALGLASCGSEDAGGGSSGSAEIRYSSPLGESAPQNVLVKEWADQIEEGTDGQLTVKAFYDGSLLKTEDSIPGVGDGRADLSMGSPQYHPGELVISSVTELPFVTQNAEAQTLAIRDAYESEEAFRQEWNNMGVEVLLFVPTGANVIVTEKPMASVDDMDGLSIRAVGRTASALEAVGASPKSVPISEAYEGLERGLFDAISSLSVNVADQIGALDAAPHIYDAGFGEYTVIVITANKQWYDGLPEDQRAAIEDATESYYEGFADTLAATEEELCTKLLADGVEFTEWSEAEIERWDTEAGEQIRSQWASEVGGSTEIDADAFLEQHMQRVADYEAASDFEPMVPACAAQQ